MNAFNPDRESFATVMDLLAIVANPAAAQTRLEALQAKIAELAEGRTALEAERVVVGEEIERARTALAEERAFASRLMAAAQGEKATAESLRETAEAYAEKIGYRDRPSVVPIGSGGLTMTVFGETEEETSQQAKPDRPGRATRDDFPDHTTLTRAISAPEAPAPARPTFRGAPRRAS